MPKNVTWALWCFFNYMFDYSYLAFPVHSTHSSGTRKLANIGRPTRSASSLLTESTPKNQTDQVKAKFGLIDCSASRSESKKEGFILQPVRPQSTEKSGDESEKQYRPTLSPFFKDSGTPMVKESKKKAFETPQGYNYNIFASISKQQQTESKRGKESLKDVVASLDFVNTPPPKSTEESLFKEFSTNEFKTEMPSNDVKETKDRLQECIDKADGAINQSKMFLDQNKCSIDTFQTPVNKISKRNIEKSASHYQTCPKPEIASSSTRKPLTEVKLPNKIVPAFANPRKQRLDFEANQHQSFSKPIIKDIVKENKFNSALKKRIPLSSLSTPVSEVSHSRPQPQPNVVPTSSGLTELIQSIDLLKENKPVAELKNLATTNTIKCPPPIPNTEQFNSSTKTLQKQEYERSDTVVAPKNDNPSNERNDVNNSLQNAIKTFGMNGFNMDQRLGPVPVDTKFIRINGKPYTQVKKIARGGFCKVNFTRPTFLTFIVSFFFILRYNI